MRVIIVGSGEVGRHIANTLSGEQHEVTMIDRDEARSDAAQNELDALVVTGNGARLRVLREEGPATAALLLAGPNAAEATLRAAAAGIGIVGRTRLGTFRNTNYLG